jgi:hypothetical protein
MSRLAASDQEALRLQILRPRQTDDLIELLTLNTLKGVLHIKCNLSSCRRLTGICWPMALLKIWMSRPTALAATVLASWPFQASADPAFSPQRPIMPPSIRPAKPRDMAGIVALLTQAALERRSLDPLLWRLAADAQTRVERAVGAALKRTEAPAQELWLIAERSSRIVGVTHAILVPVPPIYDRAEGPPDFSWMTALYPPMPHLAQMRPCSLPPRLR